jgi:hypothetical protein
MLWSCLSDEFEEVGLAFDEVGEEIGILRGEGAELVEERLLGRQLLAERNAWVAVHEASRRRDATHREIKVGRRKFTDGFACRPFCYGAHS